jgi:hypothetical protein
MRVERLAQPRLDLVGIAAGGQLDHVPTVSDRGQARAGISVGQRPWRSNRSYDRASLAALPAPRGMPTVRRPV